ncbi:MAG: class I SAM-dependent RNA methyltransferase [Alphaproteobacteria bacterium]|jgi:23S rRNA (uracil1939-C5)-methyltransferase|nr:class I SAM-dependent RNA methyltransferase [Alphaproteobacteria bacterium]MCB9984608.1 class I SAM-dependent RNA methyltransferase [Micavibrio sp.]HPQ50450.1 class I SAM-dependent RNA methyltransferase [Alphaproteobacteria bacterium]
MTQYTEFEFPPEQLQKPPCPHFKECGSCQLQHVKQESYEAWKEQRVKALLAENNLEPEEWKPSVFVGAGSRRRVSLNILREDKNVILGYNKFHSHDLALIEDCLLLTPQLSKIIKILPAAMLKIAPKGHLIEVMIQEADEGMFDCLITGLDESGARQTGEIASLAEKCGFCRVSFRKDTFSESVTQIAIHTPKKTNGALCVLLPAGAFLQPSALGETALVKAVMDGLSHIKLGKRDKVIDLFSGCGTFAGELLSRCSVHAVEGDWPMASCLIEAAKGHARFSAEIRDLYKEPFVNRELRNYKAVVFDPPRAGAKEQCQTLAKSDIPVIIGVSCNPATFARDSKILTSGGYQFKSLQIVDQFSWSTHVELVGVFEKI